MLRPRIAIRKKTNDNPYLLMNPNIIAEIVGRDDRDVDIGRGSFNEKARQLYELDTIDPEWRQQIDRATLSQLGTLTIGQLYTYAAIKGFDVNAIYQSSLSKNTLADVLVGLSLCSQLEVAPQATVLHPTTLVIKDLNQLIDITRKNQLPYVENVRGIFTNIDERDSIDVIQKLAEYPLTINADTYNLIRTLRVQALAKVLEFLGIYRTITLFMSREELIFTISRRYVLPYSQRTERSIHRYSLISRLSTNIRNLIVELYGYENDLEPLIEVAKIEEIHPLESIICMINDYPHLELAKQVGMIIPPNVNITNYFLANILSYKKIFTRRDNLEPPNPTALSRLRVGHYHYLEQFTDQELFVSLGLYLEYSSRHDLLQKLVSLRTTSRFFIPLIRNCTNTTTLLYNNTRDVNVFIIAFGILTNYIGYETDELMNSFHYKNDEDFVFLHPENIRTMFSNDHIEQLGQLLINYPELVALNQKINEGLVQRRQKTDYDRTLLQTVRSLRQEHTTILRRYLYRVFLCGMYMRKWEGPPHPYPMNTKQTEKKMTPDENTHRELIELQGISEMLPRNLRTFVNDLRIVEYYGAVADQTHLRIGAYVQEVSSGRECIRMASSKFVGTGYYYLKVLFNEVIPNFDPSQLDRIH